MIAIEHTTLVTLSECYCSPLHTKGDYARHHANEIGRCASLGLITTFVPLKGFTNKWHITTEGLVTLAAHTPTED